MPSPTRQELKAAMNVLIKASEMWLPWFNADERKATQKHLSILRAHLETFDEREDFVEAAMKYVPHMIPPDRPRSDEEFEAAMLRALNEVGPNAVAFCRAYRAMEARKVE